MSSTAANAEALRKRGNDHFKRAEYDAAVTCYTEAGDATSLANRAAAFNKLSRYEDAVEDCAALVGSSEIDDGVREKVYGRLAHALLELGLDAWVNAAGYIDSDHDLYSHEAIALLRVPGGALDLIRSAAYWHSCVVNTSSDETVRAERFRAHRALVLMDAFERDVDEETAPIAFLRGLPLTTSLSICVLCWGVNNNTRLVRSNVFPNPLLNFRSLAYNMVEHLEDVQFPNFFPPRDPEGAGLAACYHHEPATYRHSMLCASCEAFLWEAGESHLVAKLLTYHDDGFSDEVTFQGDVFHVAITAYTFRALLIAHDRKMIFGGRPMPQRCHQRHTPGPDGGSGDFQHYAALMDAARTKLLDWKARRSTRGERPPIAVPHTLFFDLDEAYSPFSRRGFQVVTEVTFRTAYLHIQIGLLHIYSSLMEEVWGGEGHAIRATTREYDIDLKNRRYRHSMNWLVFGILDNHAKNMLWTGRHPTFHDQASLAAAFKPFAGRDYWINRNGLFFSPTAKYNAAELERNQTASQDRMWCSLGIVPATGNLPKIEASNAPSYRLWVVGVEMANYGGLVGNPLAHVKLRFTAYFDEMRYNRKDIFFRFKVAPEYNIISQFITAFVLTDAAVHRELQRQATALYPEHAHDEFTFSEINSDGSLRAGTAKK